MAIAFDAASTAHGGSTGTSVTWSHTVAAGSDRCLIVSLGTNGVTATGVTYAGVGMTKIGEQQEADTGHTVSMWSLVAPSTGANNVVASFSEDRSYSFVATSWTGVHQATPTSSMSGNRQIGAPSTTPTVTIASAADEIVVDSVIWNQNALPATETVDASQTQRGGPAVGNFVRCAVSSEAGAASVGMDWTMSSATNWAIGAISLRPSTAGSSANITFDAASSISTGNTTNEFTFQHTCSGNNRALFVLCANNSPALAHGVRYAGVPMTNVVHQQEVNTGKRISIWKLSNPTSGLNTVAISFSATVAGCFGAASFNGCFQTTSGLTRTPNSTQGVTAAAAITVSSTSTDMVIGVGIWSEGITGSEGPQQTLMWQDTISVNDLHNRVSRESGSATVVISYGLSASSNYAIAAVSFAAAPTSAESQSGQTMVAQAPFFPLDRFPIVGFGFMCQEASVGPPIMSYTLAHFDLPMHDRPPKPAFMIDMPRPGNVSSPAATVVTSESIGPRISLVPQTLTNVEQWKRQAQAWMTEANQGHLQNTGVITLQANTATTVVSDMRAGVGSFIGFTPRTANATIEMANGTMYVSARGKQTFTITHANNAQTDRTFVYAILG